MQGNADAFPTLQDTYIVPSRRAWNPYTNDNNPWTPEAYWQHRMRLPNEQDSQFVARIAELTAENRAAYNVLLKELLPQLSSWKIELSRGHIFIQYETAAGAKHAADLFGDGMASLSGWRLPCMILRQVRLSLLTNPNSRYIHKHKSF